MGFVPHPNWCGIDHHKAGLDKHNKKYTISCINGGILPNNKFTHCVKMPYFVAILWAGLHVLLFKFNNLVA